MSDSARGLREAFDASFAKPASPALSDRQDLLVVRAGSNEVAIRITDVAAIGKCPELTPLPAARPGVLGLAGMRGHLVVVHSLAALAGAEASARVGGFVLLCAADRSVALHFDDMIGYLRAAPDDLVGERAEATGKPVVVRRSSGRSLALVDLGAVLETIHGSGGPRTAKES